MPRFVRCLTREEALRALDSERTLSVHVLRGAPAESRTRAWHDGRLREISCGIARVRAIPAGAPADVLAREVAAALSAVRWKEPSGPATATPPSTTRPASSSRSTK